MSFSHILFVFLFLFLSSCGKGFNINTGKLKKVDQKLGTFLAESRPLEGDHLEKAKAGCGALLKQRDEIRPGFLYKFHLNATSCETGIEVQQDVSARLDQDEGNRWYFRPEGGTPARFLDQVVFHDGDPFNKICEQVLSDDKSTISDTVVEGLSATQFKFSPAGQDFVFADVLTAYKDRPDDDASSVKVHKKERFKIYLGETAGHSPLSTLSPAGTVTLRLRETICGNSGGGNKGNQKNVVKMDRFEQTLKSIQP